MLILVTGGTGYIGSNTCVKLMREGYDVAIIDNLSNSNIKKVKIIEELGGKSVKFYQKDLINRDQIDNIFEVEKKIDAVIHFAGLKAVGESVVNPLQYYNNNIIGTLNLLECMRKHNVNNLIFSSSATVYGEVNSVPISEESPLMVKSPYGRTKLIQEEILKDLYNSDSRWNFMILRYFNPVGMDESGKLCEEPSGIPNNLMPYIQQVAKGQRRLLNVFGNDYNTKDGTGVRDYIHVLDLAEGHITALKKMLEHKCGLNIYNLGTGIGHSVLDVIETYKKINNVEIPYTIVGRREGDVAQCFADVKKVERELNWRAVRTLDEMCYVVKYD